MNAELGPKTISMLVTTVFLLGVGQVLFKYAASNLDFGSARSYLSLPLASALCVYALATLAWLFILSRIPLSVAFPFYGLAFLIVPLLSAWLLGEPLRWSTLVGGAIILVGIAISSSRR